jgi:glutamate dehydrogenase
VNEIALDRPDRTLITLKALKAAFTERLGLPGVQALDRGQAEFLAQVHSHCAADELAEMSLPDLAALLVDFWNFADRRRTAEAKVRLIAARGADGRPLDRQVLEAVVADSPFIVDSVMGELVAAGATVLAMFHPLVEVARDSRGKRIGDGPTHRESMLHVLIEPLDEVRSEAVLSGVRSALADLKAAVDDFPEMVGLMGRTIAELEQTPLDNGAADEALAFLRWLEAERFVFLGARVYDYPARPGRRMPVEHGLGVLRDPERAVLRDSSDPALRGQEGPRAEEPLVVAKANMRSRVHRRAYMDYVGVKRYGDDGKPCGEVRFVGLFTSEAYDQPVEAVPFIRRKMARVLARAGPDADSHNGRRLRNILETYPRDELFQIGEDELASIAQKIMHLYDRPRLRLFARRDPFDRFISVLLFVPRTRYSETLAEQAGGILAGAWGGRVSAHYPQFSDGPLALVHYIIGVEPGAHPTPDMKALEAAVLEASRTWEDRFDAALRTADLPPARKAEIALGYRAGFPVGYRDSYPAHEALADIAVLETLAPGSPVRVRAYRWASDAPFAFRLKLYRRGEAAALSDVMPIIERIGLRALSEHGFSIRPGGAETPLWVHEIQVEAPGLELAFDAVKAPFEDAFLAVWSGLTENDGFNRLVLELGVGWRDAALVRALARYRQQTGMDPSQAVQEAALSAHPGVARLILDLFRTRFDPAIRASVPQRADQAAAIFVEILEALQAVDSLDEDRVLRRLALLVRALQRTNYYQLDGEGRPKAHISFKIASQMLEDLPAPKPFREIFVWSPEVEGVHLRFGPVARGGLRWSDRRDDFRTEVLGLAKAQQVKNAVIVPVGAKGGFYPKALPKAGTPDQVRAEGVRAYTTFLHGLLDITDNLDSAGKVVPPEGVIRQEGDDPYLVVAADKGTASFSDIANRISEDYGFWLGDAFASGGSAGYDHKVMGITARGAWEAVKRHFRELGKDIQAEPFTVVGVGDMSGDVFGNGMLLSRQIRLLAAFDHRHVFIDPDPDPEVSFGERERLFALPRSSWADYDPARLSKGGGVFPRSAKSVTLSPEARAMLGVEGEALTIAELIQAILKAEAELLYLGGIGAYVKAPTESHAEVGDKVNDPIRVDATDLRVKVVGEGANLGVTQAGRIAFARAGGRIDTDAIDNSAGVDSSDHEVNIKILLGAVERTGGLTRASRNRLLKSMTDQVAAHVLRHNYDQTLALSLMEAAAPLELDSQAQFMTDLVAAGRLDRRVEGLPGPVAIAELAKAGQGLSRPELAVLLAYGKLELSREIVESSAPDDPVFAATLKGYFPTQLARFGDELAAHPLRRQIIATVLANRIVNRAGPMFAPRLRAATDCDTRGVVVAFEAARRIFRLDTLWAEIDSLDGKIPSAVQTRLYLDVSQAWRRQTYWLARRVVDATVGVEPLVEAYQAAADSLRKAGPALFSPFERRLVEARTADAVAAGAPESLALAVSVLAPLTATTDVADMAEATGWDPLRAGRIYHQAGAAFGFDRLRAAAGSLGRTDRFERRAVRRVIEDLLAQQAAIASDAIRAAGKAKTDVVEAWSADRPDLIAAARRTMADVEAADGGWTFAKLTVVAGALRELAQTVTR